MHLAMRSVLITPSTKTTLVKHLKEKRMKRIKKEVKIEKEQPNLNHQKARGHTLSVHLMLMVMDLLMGTN